MSAFGALVVLAAACSPAPASDAGPDASPPGNDAARGPSALRLIAPLSSAVVTAPRPVLRWRLPDDADGAQVELCATRACDRDTRTFDAAGTQAQVPADLAPGAHFWRIRARVGATVRPAATPAWEFFVRRGTAPRASAWGATPDFNGDGLSDVVVGATQAEHGTGAVFVYPGARAGVAAMPARAIGRGLGGQFATAMACAGDLDGDGYPELIAGAPGTRGLLGAAYVFAGGASGPSTTQTQTLDAATTSTQAFGAALAAAGDVNGDGYGDVIVGAPGEMQSAGAAYVFFGSPAGVAAAPSARLAGPDGLGGSFGAAVASAGDVNADGFDDVLVGAPGAASGAGRAYVFLGTAQGPSATPAATLAGTSGTAEEFGAALALVGDVNGDGAPDVAVTAPTVRSNTGRVYVFHGTGTALDATPRATIDGPDGVGSEFGWSVAAARDTDGDGMDDVIAGAVCAPFGMSNGMPYPGCGDGRAYLFRGGSAGVASRPAWALARKDGPGTNFGWVISGVGDVNGDGLDDIAVGVPSAVGTSGRTYVFQGAAMGADPGGMAVNPAPAATLENPDAIGANFGASLARLTRSTAAPACARGRARIVHRAG